MGFVGIRASALAFHFFLALIPFGLVIVVLCDNLSFFDLDNDIVPILANFIPKELFDNFIDNMHQFQHSAVNSIISTGFVLALYFSSNGFSVMIRSFNHSVMKFQKRNWWSIRPTAFLLVIIFVLGILGLLFIILYARKLLTYWATNSDFIGEHFGGVFFGIAFIVVAISLYCGISLLYYLGPSKRKTFRFFSAGATLATVLIIIISEGYTLYVENMARYDELYGSVGTLMIIMLWVYLMSYSLLIGFELNASIRGAIHKKRLDNLNNMEKRYDKTDAR